MDASELAKVLLAWEQARRRLDELEAAIRDSVLQIGATQTVGNVRATYSGGRKSYDYKAAAGDDVDQALYEAYTTTRTTTITDWRKLVLDGMKVPQDAIPFTQSDPGVSISLLV